MFHSFPGKMGDASDNAANAGIVLGDERHAERCQALQARVSGERAGDDEAVGLLQPVFKERYGPLVFLAGKEKGRPILPQLKKR